MQPPRGRTRGLYLVDNYVIEYQAKYWLEPGGREEGDPKRWRARDSKDDGQFSRLTWIFWNLTWFRSWDTKEIEDAAIDWAILHCISTEFILCPGFEAHELHLMAQEPALFKRLVSMLQSHIQHSRTARTQCYPRPAIIPNAPFMNSRLAKRKREITLIYNFGTFVSRRHTLNEPLIVAGD